MKNDFGVLFCSIQQAVETVENQIFKILMLNHNAVVQKPRLPLCPITTLSVERISQYIARTTE